MNNKKVGRTPSDALQCALEKCREEGTFLVGRGLLHEGGPEMSVLKGRPEDIAALKDKVFRSPGPG